MTSPGPEPVADFSAKHQLRSQVLTDISDNLDEFIEHAQTACWETMGNVHTTFTTTVTIKKKVSNDETTYHVAVESRERIPKPKITRELDFNKATQLVLL